MLKKNYFGMIKVECKICGKEFKVKKYRESSVQCCSNFCRYKLHSLKMRGNQHGFQKGHQINKGKKRSEIVKRKIKKSLIVLYENGFVNPTLGKHWVLSEKQRKKWSDIRIGKRTSVYITKKCSYCGKEFAVSPSRQSRKFCSRRCVDLMGRSEKTKKKISETSIERKCHSGRNNPMYGVRGKDAPGWVNGKSFEYYPSIFTKALKERVRYRDNYICQKCFTHQCNLEGHFKKMAIHHIDYNKQNCKENNLITLCPSCNSRVNKNRNHWQKYFENNINNLAFYQSMYQYADSIKL